MVSFFYGGWMLQQSQRPQFYYRAERIDHILLVGLGAKAIAPTAHCRIKYRKKETLTHRKTDRQTHSLARTYNIQHIQYVGVCAQ